MYHTSVSFLLHTDLFSYLTFTICLSIVLPIHQPPQTLSGDDDKSATSPWWCSRPCWAGSSSSGPGRGECKERHSSTRELRTRGQGLIWPRPPKLGGVSEHAAGRPGRNLTVSGFPLAGRMCWYYWLLVSVQWISVSILCSSEVRLCWDTQRSW